MSTVPQPLMRGALAPAEPIPGLSGCNMGHFWSWAYSNLLENTVRPAFAEFVVGTLLGVTGDGRKVWDAVDLRYGAHAIEVKSAAYVQAWQQNEPSRIQFDIARKLGWDHDTNTRVASRGRLAHCYVFCLYPETDRAQASPLAVSAWRFWVLPTARIDQEFGDQRSVTMSRLAPLTVPVTATTLRCAVHEALGLEPIE